MDDVHVAVACHDSFLLVKKKLYAKGVNNISSLFHIQQAKIVVTVLMTIKTVKMMPQIISVLVTKSPLLPVNKYISKHHKCL